MSFKNRSVKNSFSNPTVEQGESAPRLKSLLGSSRIIPALRSEEDLMRATASSASIVYLLGGTLSNIDHLLHILRNAEKEVMVNLDLFSGLARDSHAVAYLAASGVAGVISTHVDVLNAARANGLFAIQRTFILDSSSVESSMRSLRHFVPDALELLPAPVAPRILKHLKAAHKNIATIAGGLITSLKEADELVNAGIDAVSVGNPELWQI